MKGELKNLLLAAMAFLFVAGCSNIALEEAVVEGADAGDKYELIVGVQGFEEYDADLGRYISPTAYASNATFTKLTISGVSNHKDTLSEQELKKGTDGKYKIALAPDVWYLTLKAFDGTAWVLAGNTTADLRHGGTKVTFELTTDGVTTAGSVELSGTFDDPSSVVKSYIAGLYDITTGVAVDGSVIDLAVPGTGKTFEYKPTATIAPGSYLFKLTPYKDAEGKNPCRTVYAEMIDIAPGRQTKSTTVKITGIETVPVAPENLTAVLINSSEDDLNEFYTVKLSWTPKSYNEDGYILKIYSDYDADSKAVVTTGTPVVTLKNTVKAGETDVETFVSSNYYVSGNLGRATKECEIKLPTGTLFNVTLKSWNDVGESESVCTLSDATAKSGETAFTAKFIGRTRVTYNLNGGVLNGSVANVVKFFTFNPTKAYDVVLSGTDKLVKDKNPFKYWTSKINGSEAEKIESYDGYNDLTVWAAYNVQAEIDYTVNDVYTELALASVMNGTEEVTADTAGYLVKEDDSTEVTFTVGDDTDSYNYVKVYGNGMEIASGTGRTVTMDLSKVLEGGTYNVTLIAFDGTKKYSCNVVLVVAKK